MTSLVIVAFLSIPTFLSLTFDAKFLPEFAPRRGLCIFPFVQFTLWN
jgi:hypothetical protein